MTRGSRIRTRLRNVVWCGLLAVLLLVLALAPGPASALPWGSAWTWPGAAARAHTDSRAACKARRSRHGRRPGHHAARCSHKPRHGASSTRPTSGPLPVVPGGVAEGNATPPSAPGSSGAPGGGEGGAGGEGGGGSPPALVHVQVTAVEFHFTLSRTTVPAGKIAFEFVNNGQDEHNLNVLSGEGSLEGSFATTESQGIRQQTMTLKKGTYTLFCSLPEHEAKGMHSTLTVQ